MRNELNRRALPSPSTGEAVACDDTTVRLICAAMSRLPEWSAEHAANGALGFEAESTDFAEAFGNLRRHLGIEVVRNERGFLDFKRTATPRPAQAEGSGGVICSTHGKACLMMHVDDDSVCEDFLRGSRYPATPQAEQNPMTVMTQHRTSALREALANAEAYLSPDRQDAEADRRRCRALEAARAEVADLVETARRAEQAMPGDATATLSSRSFGFRARYTSDTDARHGEGE